MVSKQAYATPLTTPNVETVHQVVELRPAGQQHRSELPDRLADDRHHHRDQEERPHAGSATEIRAVQRRGGQCRRLQPHDEDGEQDRQDPRQPEGQPRHRDRLVLPEVHVVQIDDVDDRDGEGRHQDRDRQRTEDRRDQRDRHGDGQRDPIGLGTFPRSPRHDRRDQGEGRHRFVGLGRERAASPQVFGADVLAADVAEVRDVGQLGVASGTVQRTVLLAEAGDCVRGATTDRRSESCRRVCQPGVARARRSSHNRST